MIPLPSESINERTIRNLQNIALGNKLVAILPTSTRFKGNDQSFEKIQRINSVKGLILLENNEVSQNDAHILLQQFKIPVGSPAETRFTQPSKEMKNYWNSIPLSEREVIQKSINTDIDGKLGKRTVLALQRRARGASYE